jgi:hypothetical protein
MLRAGLSASATGEIQPLPTLGESVRQELMPEGVIRAEPRHCRPRAAISVLGSWTKSDKSIEYDQAGPQRATVGDC